MEKILEMIVLVALAAAFVVLLVKKWGWAEWMQVHGDKYLSRLFGCDLCMSFWACVVLSFCLCLVTDDAQWMLVPMFSTPIARLLV